MLYIYTYFAFALFLSNFLRNFEGKFNFLFESTHPFAFRMLCTEIESQSLRTFLFYYNFLCHYLFYFLGKQHWKILSRRRMISRTFVVGIHECKFIYYQIIKKMRQKLKSGKQFCVRERVLSFVT